MVGEPIDAVTAQRLGLVNEVVATDSDPSVLLAEGNPDQEALL